MNPDKITTLIGVAQLSSTALMSALGVNETYIVAANSLATAIGFYFTNKASKAIVEVKPTINADAVADIAKQAIAKKLADQLKKQL